MKRVQASTGTLDNMAAAHATAPIRRIIFIALAPAQMASSHLDECFVIDRPMPALPLGTFASLDRVPSGFEGVAGELSDRLLFASADRLSLSRPAIADQSQGAETRQQERPARGLRHADLDRKRIGVQAAAPAPNVSTQASALCLGSPLFAKVTSPRSGSREM